MSHDMLLAANGHRATHTGYQPLALADVASSREAELPTATCELAPGPESAKAARDFTRRTLREWRMARLSDVAELVVSELVTNALRHGLLSARWMPGEHPIGLRLLRQEPYLLCMVTDPDTAGPVRMDAHRGAEGGRGLQVVESCSVRWGWQPLDARALEALALDPRALDPRALDSRALDSRALDPRELGGRTGQDGPGQVGKVVWALLRPPKLRRITSG